MDVFPSSPWFVIGRRAHRHSQHSTGAGADLAVQPRLPRLQAETPQCFNRSYQVIRVGAQRANRLIAAIWNYVNIGQTLGIILEFFVFFADWNRPITIVWPDTKEARPSTLGWSLQAQVSKRFEHVSPALLAIPGNAVWLEVSSVQCR